MLFLLLIIVNGQNNYTGFLVVDGRGIGYFCHYAGLLLYITPYTPIW